MNQASAFDPDSFLDAEVPADIATEYTPVPEFDAARAMIKPGSIKARQVTNKDTGHVSTILNFDWLIDEQEARDATGMDEPIARSSLFIDLEDGKIAKGTNKNVQLGILLEALGLLSEGFTFRMLEGQMGRVKIRHRFGDEGQIYAEVKGVQPIE